MTFKFPQTAAYTRNLADLLLGDFAQFQYRRIILAFSSNGAWKAYS